MNNERYSFPCGCTPPDNIYTGEGLCENGKRFFEAWEKAVKLLCRLQTRGNEIALEKAFKAYHQHFYKMRPGSK